MIRIENVRFHIDLCGGYKNDSWRLCGDVYGHPVFRDGHNVSPSSPISFDESKLIFETYSGRIYQIGSFHPDAVKEKIIEEIHAVVKNNGLSRC